MFQLFQLSFGLLCFYVELMCLHQATSSGAEPLMFCYYSSSSQLRPEGGKFQPEDIDPSLCSHVIFAFADLVKGTLHPGNANDLQNGNDKGLYSRTMELRKRNPSMRILLAVGGWRAASAPFVEMIKSDENRQGFLRSAVSYLRRHGFDGLDIDWEFPGTRGSDPGDRILYTGLLKDLREAFDKEAEETGSRKLLLTIAVSGGSYYINLAYEAKKISRYVDYILIMAYNYHGSWNDYTGHHSALYARSDEVGGEREWNQAWSVDFWLNDAEAPKSKVVLGLATYGMTFTLSDQAQHGMKAKTIGAGTSGKYTQEAGTLAYYEICENLKNGWTRVWEEEQKVPYAYKENHWVGYDDPQSLVHKVDHIVNKELAGAFIWSLDMDDFKGSCGDGKYPLLSSIVEALRQSSSGRKAETPIYKHADDGEEGKSRVQSKGRIPSRTAYHHHHISQPESIDKEEKEYERRRKLITRGGGNNKQESIRNNAKKDFDQFTYDRKEEEEEEEDRRSSLPLKRSEKAQHKSYDTETDDENDSSEYSPIDKFPYPTEDRNQSPLQGSRNPSSNRKQISSNGHDKEYEKVDWYNGFRSKVEMKNSLSSGINDPVDLKKVKGDATSGSSARTEDGSYTCIRSGLFPDPISCRFYYICVLHGSKWYHVRLSCPDGLAFKPEIALCGEAADCE